jgi:hypothetical protein
VVLQAASQQFPVPLIPHTPEVHASSAAQDPTARFASQAPLALLQ